MEMHRVPAADGRAAAMSRRRALAAAGRPLVDRVIMALVDPDTANQALDYVVELGTARPSALVPYLKNSDAIVRERVVMAMGFVADPGVEAALTALTTDGDPSVRRAAETALIRTRTAKRPAAPRPTP